MGFKDKLSFHRWNIGFIEASINDVINNSDFKVKWVKHKYRDRFFADPFILDYNNNQIRVLVEEYPFFTRKGIISLLTINRRTYDLIDKHVLIDKKYHQSYPFILRYGEKIYIIPEASESGALWIYEFDGEKIIDRRLLLQEPLLDSTIIQYKSKWWLFCTKRGNASNRDLFVYVSDNPTGGYEAISKEPLKSNLSSSRPGGYMIEYDNEIFRVTQDCSKTYGGGITLTKVTNLSGDTFKEDIIKPIEVNLSDFNEGFHTINEYKGLIVVDGIKSEFRPLKKILYTLHSKFQR